MPVRRKGFRGVGNQSKGDQEELGRQGCGMRGAGENMDGGVEFPSTRKPEGTGGLVLYSQDRNGES